MLPARAGRPLALALVAALLWAAWPRHRDRLALVGMFRNEEGSLCEWVRHHQEQGVSHFYLVDNNSSDNWEQTLRGLRAYPSHVTVVRDMRKNEQPNLYNEARRRPHPARARLSTSAPPTPVSAPLPARSTFGSSPATPMNGRW